MLISGLERGTGDEAGRLLAAIDWSRHPLGEPSGWPPMLHQMLRYMRASPDICYLIWGAERTFFFNDMLRQLVGPRIDAAMGGDFAVVMAVYYDEIGPNYEEARHGRPARMFDLPVLIHRTDPPRQTWWSVSFTPLFADDGSVPGVICVGTETTSVVLRHEDQRRSALRLAEAQRSLQRAQEAGQIGVFSIDIAQKRVSGTPEFFRLFGLAQGDHVPAHVIEGMVIPEDQHLVSHDADRRAETAPLNVEYRIRRPDTGEVRCIERRAEFEHDDDGAPTRLVGVVQDVTARRAAQDALAQLNATLEERVRERTAERNLLARIVEETDSFVQLMGPDLRWLAINRAAADEFARTFGVTPRVGDGLDDLLADQPDALAVLAPLWTRALAGEDFTATATVGDPARAGNPRSYRMRFATVRAEDGRPIGASLYAFDITERLQADAQLRQMEEALRQSQKMEAMGQLTGGVAHDFNNLLTPIIGSLDLLHRRAALTDREARLVDGALQSAERAKTLVQRLLAFARRQPLQTGPVDVAALVAGMAGLVTSTSGPQIALRTDVAPGLPPALADAHQLEMAILNLCVNARDAMPDGGAITVAARAAQMPEGVGGDAAAIALSVADTGTGMAPHVLARAIEPFFSTKGVGKGTGLGLSMVHGLALQLGGTMRIASTPGEGTRVELFLPLSAAPATPRETEPAAAPDPAFRGRVLVIDDEALVRRATAHLLESLGYATVELETADEAMVRLEAGDAYDLLVTDHLMPGMSGAELALMVRKRWPQLPVLIVSGYADVEEIAPDVPRLAKPFREAQLARAIAAIAG